VTPGRRRRIDTTVVETNIHYPTDSSLLGDGVRALTRTMKKIAGIAETAGAKLRDWTRSVRRHLLNIARAARSKSQPNQEKLTEIYGKLLAATGRVVGQAKRFSREIAGGVKRAADPRRQLRLAALRQQLEQMLPRIGQVTHQTHGRIFAGDTHAEGKIVSNFEPSTDIIRKSLPPRRRRQGGRQCRQADRVRQDGKAARSGESDHHHL
jgi:IS5 family transposase